MTHPVCAIVGAGDGLGKSLAARFAREGYRLLLASRSAAGSAAALAAAEAAAPGAGHEFVAADATRPEQLEAALAGAADGEDVATLIYNARGGYQRCAPLEMSYADLDETYRLEAHMPPLVRSCRA
jgi:NAD(P)-dependent dehydrogenase (short-subunit alcohol dehydrogenase family)